MQRHDHAVARGPNGEFIAEDFVCELLYTAADGSEQTVYGWDVPPFVAFKQDVNIRTPGDALLLYIALRQRQRARKSGG